MDSKTQGETKEQILAEEIKNEKIRRAMLAGPSCITTEAAMAEMDFKGQLTVLRNLDVVLQGISAVVGTSVSGLGGQEVLGIGGAGELLA
jgi:hypothetical protein